MVMDRLALPMGDGGRAILQLHLGDRTHRHQLPAGSGQGQLLDEVSVQRLVAMIGQTP